MVSSCRLELLMALTTNSRFAFARKSRSCAERSCSQLEFRLSRCVSETHTTVRGSLANLFGNDSEDGRDSRDAGIGIMFPYILGTSYPGD